MYSDKETEDWTQGQPPTGERTMNAERIENIANLAGTTADIAADLINADWDNMTDHDTWLETAPDAEIANWIKSCRQGIE